MTNRQQIISYLRNHSEPIDDDELAKVLGFSQRQMANLECRKLAKDGLITRSFLDGKIHNIWSNNPLPVNPDSKPVKTENEVDEYSNEWFWEGNVQNQIVNHLTEQDYEICSTAHTASKQHGIDIIAEKEGKPLWVTVKGFPRKTTKTQSSTQVPHWFSSGIFDVLKYRGEKSEVDIAFGLPDHDRYRNLARKISWLKPIAKFSYFWVKESGEIEVE